MRAYGSAVTRRTLLGALICALAIACTTTTRTPSPYSALRTASGLRVALASVGRAGRLTASGPWALADRGGSRLLADLRSGEIVTVEAGRSLSVRGATRDLGPVEPPLVVRPTTSAVLVSWGGHRYRGQLVVSAASGELRVANELPLEDYLRGVIALEIGADAPQAAQRAQAVAARSYAMARLGRGGAWYDLAATVADQVYGGVDAERAASDAAVAATRGEVLMYAGRIATAPYHSACGGATEDAASVWAAPADVPYLRSVSDAMPGTDRFYCDGAPLQQWTRQMAEPDLRTRLQRYERRYVASGRVRDVVVATSTRSGRVASVLIRTDGGSTTLRGGEIREAFRSGGGAILPSTYFSLAVMRGTDSSVLGVTIRGRGSGHGVGMCQWGAIGRARAGEDYRAILQAYYPGTTIGSID
ncbi:MAG: SpoIID/LytB domain-containing protein [Gemmatimonadaceae bacterium]